MKQVCRFLALLLPLVAGCSSTPEPETQEGVRTEVTILSGGFVLFEAERIPMDSFLLEMRERVRNAGGDKARFPSVVIEVGPDVSELTGQAMVQRLMDGLRAAGVAEILAGTG